MTEFYQWSHMALADEAARLRDRNAQLESLCGELVSALRVAIPHIDQASKDAKAGWVEPRRVGLYAKDLETVQSAIAHADTLMEKGR